MNTKLIRKLPLVLLLWIVTTTLYAQSGHRLDVHAGMAGMAFRDRGMSPLLYTGQLLSGGLTYCLMQEEREMVFDFTHQRGVIHNAYSNHCRYRSLALSTQTIYPLRSYGMHTLLLGWTNHNHFHIHQNEQFTNFSERSDYFTSFGALLGYRADKALNGRKLRFELPVEVALLGFYLRPSFVSNAPKGYVEPGSGGFRGFLNSIDPFVPWNDWFIGAHPQTTLVMKNGNGVSIGYRFQWLGLNEPVRITMANGYWNVSLKTTLR